ncbi:MAG: efflux RND transporter periplasmic adaptor subunit [Bryobacterales bacterium]|nr:efflux RND transporter periplasmic adaptor subunit [Bryobacterales bacterium]
MTLRWKIAIALGLTVTAAAGGYASYVYHRRGIVAVQTGWIIRQDLQSIVTASGEIKPRNYVNIGANAMGRVTEILVAEGDRVRKGQLLARLESVQPEAEVRAQRAALSSAEAESAGAEASLRTADENIASNRAAVARAKAELERAELDYKRAQELLENKLIARQEFDQRAAVFRSQQATVREAEARLVGAEAGRQEAAARLSASQRRITQSRAVLARVADVLDKHSAVAPLDGMVTNLPIRVGETVVMGIQNSPGSLVMTIADMSLITAEVKVDETDIVNVQLDQPVDVTIDAIPGQSFRGRVIEIGNTAILRSTGLAASQSAISSQEAKDFKVVVALDDPPESVRPGLSCTARITTASRFDAVTAPLQAVTVRRRGDLEPEPKKEKAPDAPPDPAAVKAAQEEILGVFVLEDGKAQYRKVETGITGATDIEILSGLREGDRIITGSYKTIRTLKNGARVKVDKKKEKKADS